jgi:hypothetical protein
MAILGRIPLTPDDVGEAGKAILVLQEEEEQVKEKAP